MTDPFETAAVSKSVMQHLRAGLRRGALADAVRSDFPGITRPQLRSAIILSLTRIRESASIEIRKTSEGFEVCVKWGSDRETVWRGADHAGALFEAWRLQVDLPGVAIVDLSAGA